MSSLEKFIKIKEVELDKLWAKDDEPRLRNFSKDFIVSALHQYDTLKRKEIEGMRIKNPKCDCRTFSMGEHNCDFTSNEAVDDIIKVFKGE